MKITTFGCCRQDSLYLSYEVICIKDEIVFCYKTIYDEFISSILKCK